MDQLEQQRTMNEIITKLEKFKQVVMDGEEKVTVAFAKVDDLEDTLSNIGNVEWDANALKEEIVIALVKNTNYKNIVNQLSNFRKSELDDRYCILDDTLSYLREIEYSTTIKDVLNYTDHVLKGLKEMLKINNLWEMIDYAN